MTTDVLPKTRRLLSRSACPRELSDFAEWLTSERYTPAPIHIHLFYLDQALARLDRPHDPGPRDLAALERVFDPGGGPPTRRRLFEAARRAYVRFLRARARLTEPQPQDRFASLRREYEYLYWLTQAHMLRFLAESAELMSAADVARYGERCRIRPRQKLQLAIFPIDLRVRSMLPGYSPHRHRVPPGIAGLSEHFTQRAENVR